MIEQPTYGRALFVFNDNEEQFLAFLRGEPACLRLSSGRRRRCADRAIDKAVR
jgi:hypothetical protein